MTRFLPGDEELGKKDDDYRASNKSTFGASWNSRKTPPKRSLKRIAVIIVAIIALYFFFKNMPKDVQQRGVRPQYIHPDHGGSTSNSASKAPPLSKEADQIPSDAGEVEESKHTYGGPIKFYALAATLQPISRSQGVRVDNKNVLFAASSLKSASTLIPMACDMALMGRNTVHFAFMGRSDVSMELLKAVNGINEECVVTFHDARPDLGSVSTDFRMEVSASAALGHIETYMHPQAVIIDGTRIEDEFFMKGVRQKATALSKTLVELPENSEQTLQWITRLDAASLSAWDKINIDILVHAPPESSGSIMRLLNSLRGADFFNSDPPRLFIELPSQIDEPSKRFLENFKWPPVNPAGGHQTNYLTLRHRISHSGMTAEESALRTLESFWPANSANSHVLLLSSQAELSPLFFHYLKYAILEYRYSSGAKTYYQNLLGISLDLPSNYLDDATVFTPPINSAPKTKTTDSKTPFLWQAPNSNAALYFGDKWTELHSFLSGCLSSPSPTTLLLSGKEVSKTYPSWLESILQLARIRGYWTLYPSFPSTSEALVTLHNELYQAPEEFSDDIELQAPPSEGDLSADPKTHLSLSHHEQPLLKTHLLNILPNNGILPETLEMPLLSFDGNRVTDVELKADAEEFETAFIRDVGGCKAGIKEKRRVPGSAADLFCDGTDPVAVPVVTSTLKVAEVAPTQTNVPVANVPAAKVPAAANVPGANAPGANVPVASEKLATGEVGGMKSKIGTGEMLVPVPVPESPSIAEVV